MHPIGYPIGYVFLHDWNQLSYRISCINSIGSRRIICILQKSYGIKHILQEYTCVSCRTNASYRISCINAIFLSTRHILCIHVGLFSFPENVQFYLKKYSDCFMRLTNVVCQYRIRLILLSFSRQVQVTNLYARGRHHNSSILKLPNKHNLLTFLLFC